MWSESRYSNGERDAAVEWDRLQHLPSIKLWKTDVNKEAKEIEIPKEKLNVIRYNSESYFSILKHATYKILKAKKQ